MRNYKMEYERYHKKPAQKKRRAARNTARRRKDVDHKDGNPRNNSKGNLRVQSKSKNRSYARTKTARKRK